MNRYYPPSSERRMEVEGWKLTFRTDEGGTLSADVTKPTGEVIWLSRENYERLVEALIPTFDQAGVFRSFFGD